jgi:hypothetical protein
MNKQHKHNIKNSIGKLFPKLTVLIAKARLVRSINRC